MQADVLDCTWSPPTTDGSGRDRGNLKRALALLEAGGYEFKGTKLRERSSGRPFGFEIMVMSRDQERLALAFAGNLARAGIQAQVRLVDAVQYRARVWLGVQHPPLARIAAALISTSIRSKASS